MNVLADLGRLEEALSEGKRMLAVHCRVVPDSDPTTTILLTNLGLFAHRAERFELAVVPGIGPHRRHRAPVRELI